MLHVVELQILKLFDVDLFTLSHQNAAGGGVKNVGEDFLAINQIQDLFGALVPNDVFLIFQKTLLIRWV